MQRTGREYATCRRCRGSRYDPVAGTEWCARCLGTGQDPELIAVDVDELCMATIMRRPARVVPLFQRGGIVPRREPQRGRQTTPSNAPGPESVRARAYRLLLTVAAVAFALGFIAGRVA